MAYTPYRRCDFCRTTDYPTNNRMRYERRAWTWHPTSGLINCPNCRTKGIEAERLAIRAKLYGRETSHPEAIAAEPPAAYAPGVPGTYRRIKNQYPDAVLLFRIGDWYVAMQEDADTVSQVLGTALHRFPPLTTRCTEFPFNALDTYLPKLVRAGHRVAICDQLTDDRHPGSRAAGTAGDPAIRDLKHDCGDPAIRDLNQNGGETVVEIPDAEVPDPADRHRSGKTDVGCALYGIEHPQSMVAEPEPERNGPVHLYRKIKPQYRDALLVLRDHLGFFMLYRDAERMSVVMGVDYNGIEPMRIAPSILGDVLDKLVAANYRVAVVCDPLVDDPRNARQVDMYDVLTEPNNAAA